MMRSTTVVKLKHPHFHIKRDCIACRKYLLWNEKLKSVKCGTNHSRLMTHLGSRFEKSLSHFWSARRQETPVLSLSGNEILTYSLTYWPKCIQVVGIRKKSGEMISYIHLAAFIKYGSLHRTDLTGGSLQHMVRTFRAAWLNVFRELSTLIWPILI